MDEPNVEKDKIKIKEQSSDSLRKRKLPLLFLLLLIISILLYFSTDIHWVEITFAHLGAIGIIGLLSCGAGLIAMKKGYGYWKAFLIGIFAPVILGFGAVLLIQPGSCGGSVSLAVAILTLVTYSLLRGRYGRTVA